MKALTALPLRQCHACTCTGSSAGTGQARNQASKAMTAAEQPWDEHARLLRYFHAQQDYILRRLAITQDPSILTDDDRRGLASAYLDIVSEG